MNIKPGRLERIFIGHLAVVALLFLAAGFSHFAGPAEFCLRIMTCPVNLILNHGQWVPELPTDVILDRPGTAYGIAAVIVPFLVINSYLWAFVICHIKWQWRVPESENSVAPAMQADPSKLG